MSSQFMEIICATVSAQGLPAFSTPRQISIPPALPQWQDRAAESWNTWHKDTDLEMVTLSPVLVDYPAY